MKKVKIGVLGAYRGSSMINYCKIANNAEVVAICDRFEPLKGRKMSVAYVWEPRADRLELK